MSKKTKAKVLEDKKILELWEIIRNKEFMKRILRREAKTFGIEAITDNIVKINSGFKCEDFYFDLVFSKYHNKVANVIYKNHSREEVMELTEEEVLKLSNKFRKLCLKALATKKGKNE